MGICARENIPKWERISNDCIQEKTRKEYRSNKNRGGGGDENLALVSKTKKCKGKFFFKKGESHGEGKKFGKNIYMRKIKCYILHKNGHFSS